MCLADYKDNAASSVLRFSVLTESQWKKTVPPFYISFPFVSQKPGVSSLNFPCHSVSRSSLTKPRSQQLHNEMTSAHKQKQRLQNDPRASGAAACSLRSVTGFRRAFSSSQVIPT